MLLYLHSFYNVILLNRHLYHVSKVLIMQVLIQVAGLVTVTSIYSFQHCSTSFSDCDGVCLLGYCFLLCTFCYFVVIFFISVAYKSQFGCVFYDTISVLCSFFVYRNTVLKYCNSQTTLLYTFPVGRPTTTALKQQTVCVPVLFNRNLTIQ